MNNKKHTSSTISNIYKSRKILLNILEKRGFIIEDYNNFGINEIQIMSLNNQLDMLLNNKDNKKIYVKYHSNKLRDTHINEYIDDLFNIEEHLGKDDELLIIIKDQRINDTLEEYMNYIFVKENIFVNIINIQEILFNILDNVMVPEHKILTNKEKEYIYEKYNIMEDSELPEISRFDPVAKIIGLRPGELCEITRSSKTSITSKYYRLCQ
jgi:DNA-directed RNA polymerase subunit H (RpoH/RPB5)